MEIFKLKILQLLLPIITWKTLELSVKGIADILERTFELQLWIKEYVNSVLFDFWFLWAIFWCSLIVLLLEKMARGKIWIYLALIVLMLLLPTKLHSYLYIYIYPYFVIGFFI